MIYLWSLLEKELHQIDYHNDNPNLDLGVSTRMTMHKAPQLLPRRSGSGGSLYPYFFWSRPFAVWRCLSASQSLDLFPRTATRPAPYWDQSNRPPGRTRRRISVGAGWDWSFPCCGREHRRQQTYLSVNTVRELSWMQRHVKREGTDDVHKLQAITPSRPAHSMQITKQPSKHDIVMHATRRVYYRTQASMQLCIFTVNVTVQYKDARSTDEDALLKDEQAEVTRGLKG